MLIHFHIHYRTVLGEQIGIEYTEEKKLKHAMFQTYDGENWTCVLEVSAHIEIKYKYLLYKNVDIVSREWGEQRSIGTGKAKNVFVEDQWRSRENENNAFLSTAFTKSIFLRPKSKASSSIKSIHQDQNGIIFRLQHAQIPPHLCVGITGDIAELGDWTRCVPMDESHFPNWEYKLLWELPHAQFSYKYVLCDRKTKKIVQWEAGENRLCHFFFQNEHNNLLIIQEDDFRNGQAKWRGSGVAIPVFSLRTKEGFGIGEFADIENLVDWVKILGMNMIQVLPVNDTIANKTWQDSYPYAAISVFALHPLFIRLEAIATFKDKKQQKEYNRIKSLLNDLESIDFELVLEHKFNFLKILFEQEYTNFKNDKDVHEFFEKNKTWLKPYATFCHLRDEYATCNFNHWPKHNIYSKEIIDTLCSDLYEKIKDIEFYYFLQYHADKQLLAAKTYARSQHVVLKGDLPIGIYRYSCDAWLAPELYNMDEQAGAPPDDYAVLGQNWGFPTYNWNIMASDGFQWWRQRMQQLNRYFDALRIDHILGFFRIWQVPTDQIQGTMGLFNPRLPFSREELSAYGISGDLSRFTMPYITLDILKLKFGNDLEDIFDLFFSWSSEGNIVFKSSFDTQVKIKNFIAQNEKYKHIEESLLLLVSEVLLLVEPHSQNVAFNPRITLTSTYSFSQLDNYTKAKFQQLYNDYYYTRHDEYWKQQALWKLPAILDASDMMICGEDLGMIPKAVPGVMKTMNIMSLEIQRMPKGNFRYGQVSQYPYFSVCSPSCHDMSTIRGWWQADHINAKEFYYNYLHWSGLTPMDCTPEIVKTIVKDHLDSPSMLAIFPIQDLVGMDSTLRKEDAFSEQINEPSNPKHYWRFRFHLNIEDLMEKNELNNLIKKMVTDAGR